MSVITNFVPRHVSPYLTTDEKAYLRQVFTRFDGYPTLEEIWYLMDEQWKAFGCDPDNMDERVTAFYQHPVWLLNGLFIEQHQPSLENRRVFKEWIVQQAPTRVADFGGGFGSLARYVGQALPSAQIEVVEPHPHQAAIAIAESTSNVRFVPELSGDYDILIATDVFEHVPDPIELARETAEYLRIGGQYLMANCFRPVILCHLPQLFHFHTAWDLAMEAMGLESGERVQYARVFRRTGGFDISAAHRVGECARKLHPWIQRFPRGRARIGRLLTRWICC